MQAFTRIDSALETKGVNSSSWAYFLMFFLQLPSLYWIISDRSVWPWDMAWYGEVSVDLWYTVSRHPQQWFSAMLNAFGAKAPGIGWIGQFWVPVGRLTGAVEFGLLLFVVVTQLGTLAFLYSTGRVFFPDRYDIPLLGAIFAASAPMFVAMSHQYLTEPLQLFSASYFFWLAANARGWGVVKIIGHLATASSLALLSKASSPLYCSLPGLIAIYYCWQKPKWLAGQSHFDKIIQMCFATFGLALFAATLSWYVMNWNQLAGFIRLVSSSDVALDYGKLAPFLNKFEFWLDACRKSFFLSEVLVGLGLITVMAITVAIASRIYNTQSPQFPGLPALSVAALFHIVAVLTVFSLSINEENRYLLPMLPALAVLLYWCCSQILRRGSVMVLGALFIYQWGLVNAQSLDLIQRSPRITGWLIPVCKDASKKSDVTRLVEATCNEETRKKFSMVGVEYSWLNYNSLLFYSAKARLAGRTPKCSYTYFGHAAKDVEKTWERINSMNIIYFISVEESEQPKPPDFLNQVSIPILERIRQDQRFEPVPFQSVKRILVFRRMDKR